ncbi:MAG: hypothetical protein U0Y96_06945 [Candidatus Kapaibacterium sp.]|nr:hypothetical protein [Bacteroidota bacterium]
MRHVTILLLAALFVSCSDNSINNNTVVTPTKQIIPLRVGNNWKYISKNSTNGYDTVFISTTGKLQIGKDTYYSISGTTSNNTNGTYIGFCFLGGADNNPKYTYVANLEEGYFIGELKDLTKITSFVPRILWLYPAKLNDVYLAKFDLGDDNATSVKVFETQISVTVPAGTFKCIKYGFDLKGRSTGVYDFFIYFAPGIGPIRLEDETGKNWGDLESYKVES